MSDQTDKKTERRDWLTFFIDYWPVTGLILFGIVFTIWFTWWGWAASGKLLNPLDQCKSIGEQQGQFGDSFGALSSLFSGIGVVVGSLTTLLLILTLREQRRQIKLQEDQLNEQRGENLKQDWRDLDRQLQLMMLEFNNDEYARKRSVSYYIGLMMIAAEARPDHLRGQNNDGTLAEFIKLSADFLNRTTEYMLTGKDMRVGIGNWDTNYYHEFFYIYENEVKDKFLYATNPLTLSHDCLAFCQILHFFGRYAMILNRMKKLKHNEPARDYLRSHWGYWRQFFSPLLKKIKESRDSWGVEEVWESDLQKYDEEWQRACSIPSANPTPTS